jgi:hypothetical protein
MHCFYLKNGDVWTRGTDSSLLLDHGDKFVVCESPEDEGSVLETIQGMEPGRYVIRRIWEHEVFTSDVPIFSNIWDLQDEQVMALLSEHKAIRVFAIRDISHYWITHQSRGEKYLVSRAQDKFVGVIVRPLRFEDGKQYYELFYNYKLWRMGNNKITKTNLKKEMKRRVTCREIDVLQYALYKKAGFMPGQLSPRDGVRNIIASIIVADSVLGPRTTDEMLSEVAKLWLRDLEDNERRFEKWLCIDHIKRLTARFMDCEGRHGDEPHRP